MTRHLHHSSPTFLLIFALAGVLLPVTARSDEPLPKGHYQFTGVKVIPVDRVRENGKINDRESDQLTYWVRFDVHPQFEIIKGTEQLPFKILNPTDSRKSRLTLDKPVKFRGAAVPAGANLLKHKRFDGSRFNVSMPDLFPLAIHSVRINSDFEIPADTYTVTFDWTTKANEAITDKVKVKIDVKALQAPQ